MKAIALIGTAALALGACSQKTEDAAATTANGAVKDTAANLDRAGDAIDGAGNAAAPSLHEAGKAIGHAADATGNAIDHTGHAVSNAMK